MWITLPQSRERASHIVRDLLNCITFIHFSYSTPYADRIQDDVLVALESQQPFSAEFDIENLPVSVIHHSPGYTEVLAGSEYTLMQVKDRQFRLSGRSFFQVNTLLAEQMVVAIESALPEQPGMVLELYSGVGLFSAFIAPLTDKLVAIESSETAAEDFVHNLDQFDNVDLY